MKSLIEDSPEQYAQVAALLLGAWAAREIYRLWLYPELRQKLKANWHLLKGDAKALWRFLKGDVDESISAQADRLLERPYNPKLRRRGRPRPKGAEMQVSFT
jgi:hypothetical protein